MANVELDGEIKSKLKNAFNVNYPVIEDYLSFFNDQLKPSIKTHYLSHLVESVKDLLNNKLKADFLKKIAQEKTKVNKEKTFEMPPVELKNIILTPINTCQNGKKARLKIKGNNFVIYYADYLQENEKRFAIAHELGHIVSVYILEIDDENEENNASLFAYIALLDKNNFYQKECKEYISRTDIELFNDYISIVHV